MQVRPQRVRLSGAATLVFLALCAASPLQAQNVKPPKVQLWLDLSTGTMAGMPEMDMGNPIGGLLGGLMGGGARGGAMGGAPTTYGMARGMGISPPRLLDIALYNRLKPGQAASQAIPPGLVMGASPPRPPPHTPPPGPPATRPRPRPRAVGGGPTGGAATRGARATRWSSPWRPRRPATSAPPSPAATCPTAARGSAPATPSTPTSATP